ncbi:lysyl-tRNA synthetase class II [Jatrophihabitans sp. GAS493]|nr:lysine--tRNA ligase [Jatrophihabitans sp. GAS493]SOD70540.1 lysyl-tRNA synthetase class II [Jatrophihabitans sp. GAS493]
MTAATPPADSSRSSDARFSDSPSSDSPAIDDVLDDAPEQVRVRREKYDRLIADPQHAPYPVNVARTTSLAAVRAAHPELPPDTATGEQVGVTGRVIFVRTGGKLCFATLREGGVELQVMFSLANVGEQRLADFKADVDLGDLLFVHGEVITSRSGELSVLADEWRITAKALRPLPVAHKPLSEETRVRQRYVDLIVRPEARQIVSTRAAVIRSIRETLHERQYLEVETPILQSVHGGAAARPFHTHLNAFDLDMSLRIATELFLKRCVVGGIDRVYEIGRTFRNEGVDSTHSPEFTMLEAYEAYGDYDTMAELTRTLIQNAAAAADVAVPVTADGVEIDLAGAWRTVTIHELVSDAVQDSVDVDTEAAVLRSHAERLSVALKPEWDAGEIVLELYEKLVEHTLIQPTFVRDYPASVRPLARPHRSDPRLAEAWDLIIGGMEVAPAYSELADPVEQRRRLVEQSLAAANGDPEAMELDEDFLRALEYGMPPTGGMGMGVDRLVMLLTGRGIRETILFPLLKPLANL